MHLPNMSGLDFLLGTLEQPVFQTFRLWVFLSPLVSEKVIITVFPHERKVFVGGI